MVTLVSNTGQTTFSSADVAITLPKAAQSFTTGSNAGGYRLASIGIKFNVIDDTFTVGSELTATVNLVDSSGNPGAIECTLNDPDSYAENSVNTFTAPATCLLEATTTYFLLLEKAASIDAFGLDVTNLPAEDTSVDGWLVADDLHRFSKSTTSWSTTGNMSLLIEVKGSAVTATETEVWSAAMTAGVAGGLAGYSGTTGSLDDNDFTHQSTDYTVNGVTVSAADGLSLLLSPTPTVNRVATWTLRVDGTEFALADAIVVEDASNDPIGLRWTSNVPSWSAGTPFALALVAKDSDATGAPSVTGTVQVGETLTANTSGITDTNGVPADAKDFAYQWVRVDGGTDTDIECAEAPHYYPTEDDVGKTLKVTVSFTDLDSLAEGPLTSAASNTVLANDDVKVLRWGTMTAALTALGISGYSSNPTSALNSGALSDPDFDVGATPYAVTVISAVPSTPDYILNFGILPVSDGDVVRKWTFFVDNESLALDFAAVTPNTTTDTTGAFWTKTSITWAAGQKVALALMQVNEPAIGAPDIEGAFQQVGRVQTATLADIADENGVPTDPADFTYEWLRVDGATESVIPGETSWAYTPTDDDLGKRIKVRVSFTDGDGFLEGPLTSIAYSILAFDPASLDYTRFGDIALHSDNGDPRSLWSDGETFWVGEDTDAKVCAYELVDDPMTDGDDYGTRDSSRDITGPTSEAFYVSGDSRNLWLADESIPGTDPRSVYAYNLPGLSRDTSRDFPYYASSEGALVIRGVATDGLYLWLSDETKILKAYRLSDDLNTVADEYGTYDSSRNITFDITPVGIYTDGEHIWGAQNGGRTVEARRLADGAEADDLGFQIDAANSNAYGIWSNGLTFFVLDRVDKKIYTYRPNVENLPASGAPTITGTAYVGEELTADTSTITDPNGVPADAADFSYQWVRVDGGTETGIAGAIGATYTPVEDDLGKTIKVKVSFNDLDGYAEGPLESGESGTVQVAPPTLVKNTGQTVSTLTAQLDATTSKRAQSFTSGSNTGGYRLASIGVLFSDIADTSSAGSELTATVNVNGAEILGHWGGVIVYHWRDD